MRGNVPISCKKVTQSQISVGGEAVSLLLPKEQQKERNPSWKQKNGRAEQIGREEPYALCQRCEKQVASGSGLYRTVLTERQKNVTASGECCGKRSSPSWAVCRLVGCRWQRFASLTIHRRVPGCLTSPAHDVYAHASTVLKLREQFHRVVQLMEVNGLSCMTEFKECCQWLSWKARISESHGCRALLSWTFERGQGPSARSLEQKVQCVYDHH